MLNARTWHRLCISAYILFPSVIAKCELPDNSPFTCLALAGIIWGIIVGFFGAFLGILLALGRLSMGCPICETKSLVTGGDRNGMYLDCPQCGELQMKIGHLSKLQIIHSNK